MLTLVPITMKGVVRGERTSSTLITYGAIGGEGSQLRIADRGLRIGDWKDEGCGMKAEAVVGAPGTHPTIPSRFWSGEAVPFTGDDE